MKNPKFGDRMRGIHASESNPQRDGFFVEKIIRTRVMMNPGTYYRLTDGKGNFWEYPAKSIKLLEPEGQAGIEVHVKFTAPASPGDSEALGQQIGEEVLKAIDEGMAKAKSLRSDPMGREHKGMNRKEALAVLFDSHISIPGICKPPAPEDLGGHCPCGDYSSEELWEKLLALREEIGPSEEEFRDHEAMEKLRALGPGWWMFDGRLQFESRTSATKRKSVKHYALSKSWKRDPVDAILGNLDD